MVPVADLSTESRRPARTLLDAAFQLRWQVGVLVGRATGCRAGRRPLPFPLFVGMKRFAENGHERHALLSLCIKALAPTDLLHQIRIAQDLKAIF